VRFVARSWISTSSNSAINAGNTSVSILPEGNGPAQNPIPTILGIIIALLASTTSFFVKVVVNTGQEEAVSHLGIICVRSANVKAQSSNKMQISNIKTFDIQIYIRSLYGESS
jgi:hypothetical protein